VRGIIALVARLWIRSLRYRRIGPEVTGPALIAFWHGDQLPLLGQRPGGPLVAPISLSRDGDLQTAVLARFGVVAVRGSTSRGGARTLRGLLRALRTGACALMAVDGPRGPRGEVKPGVVFLAQRTGLPVYPVSVAVGRGRRLTKAWDRFLLPAPFTKTVVCFGDPWYPADTAPAHEQCAVLAARLRRARASAIDVISGNSQRSDIEVPPARTH
jgi:lysophospholipid acyltransferase (LPLAT)-like uncharacterized protein